MKGILILWILALCSACTPTPNRAKFKEDVSDIASGYPAIYMEILSNIGNEYCALMSTGKYHVDGSGHSPSALEIATQRVDRNKVFGGADGTAMRDVTANLAQKYLCPSTN